jgi:hypothetical protein
MDGVVRAEGFQNGICWRGNPNPKAGPSRSIPLACFAKLAAIDGLRLISLQKQEACADDETLPDLILPGEDFDTGPDAFIETAAMMQNLDLIVSSLGSNPCLQAGRGFSRFFVHSNGSHTMFHHRYHIVWITKYRYKVLEGALR